MWLIRATVLADRVGTPRPPASLAAYRAAMDIGMITGPLILGGLASLAGDRLAGAGFVLVAARSASGGGDMILDVAMSRIRARVGLGLVVVAFVVGGLVRSVAAQGDPVFTPAEAQAYKTWYDANQAADLGKALPLAADYLRTYPSGRYAEYLRSWLPQTRRQLFGAAVQAKDADAMLRLGREGLADAPEDPFYVYWLAVGLRTAELQGTAPRATHEAEMVEQTRHAIALVEAGKVPAGVDPTRFSAKATLGYLYETLSLVEEGHERWEGAAEFSEKAAAVDPGSPQHVLDCGRFHQQSYLQAVRQLQGVPDADRLATPLKPDVQAVLDRVNREADAVVDCWSRFMALTTSDNPFGDARANVEKALVELYRYRHPDDPGGLQRLIEARRSALPPASSAPAASSP